MILDIAFGILILSGLVRGYRRGFLRQTMFVGGIILGVMFAGDLVGVLGKEIEPQLKSVPIALRPSTMHVGAIAVIAIITWIVGALVFSRNREKVVGMSGPSPLDRLAGATLGVAAAAVLIALAVAGLEHLPRDVRRNDTVSGQIAASKGVQYAKKSPIAPWILDVPEVKDALAHAQTIIDGVTPGKSKDSIVDTVTNEVFD